MFGWRIVVCCTIFVSLSIVVVQGEHDVEKYLFFRLYTREEPLIYKLREEYQELNADNLPSISPTSFNPNRPTRIFIHGFRGKEKVILRYKEAYLNLGDFNFIAVDWTKGAATYNYLKAKNRVQSVSDVIQWYFVE